MSNIIDDSQESVTTKRPENIDSKAVEIESAPNPESLQVTARSFWFGLVAVGLLAWLHSSLGIRHDVHFLGGHHMPFDGLFVLLILVVVMNWPLAAIYRRFPHWKQRV